MKSLTQAVSIVVDGIPPQVSFTPASVPFPSAAPPTPSAPSQSVLAATAPSQSPAGGFLVAPVPGQLVAPGFPSSASPTFVPDFSSGGSYVLDWRDPTTKQVIVQVPMRTALASFAEADKADASVGKQVNTAV